MSKALRVGLLIIASVLCGVSASSAGAGEWHTNGPLTATSTNAGSSRLNVVGVSSTLIDCQTTSVHMSLEGPTSTSIPWLEAATVTPVLGSCTVSGAAGYAVHCGPARLRVNSYAGGTTIVTAGGGITSGSLTNIDCRISIGANTCSTVTGSVPMHYINPNPIITGVGRLTETPTGQQLEVQKIGAGCAAVPNGTGTSGAPGAGSSVTHLSFTFDGSTAPYIYATP